MIEYGNGRRLHDYIWARHSLRPFITLFLRHFCGHGVCFCSRSWRLGRNHNGRRRS